MGLLRNACKEQDTGTLFLDEIGNLPLHVQAKLLRVLQERYIERLGGQKPIPVDVRLISATNLDLEQAIRKGSFRQDLYHRLAEVVVNVPPLRERSGDIQVLADYFVAESNRKFGRQVRGIDESAWRMLAGYWWPGNVRELQNAIRYAVLACENTLTLDHLPEYIRRGAGDATPESQLTRRDMIRSQIDAGLQRGSIDFKALISACTKEVEKEFFTELLARRRFTCRELSDLLSIDPKTVMSKLQKYRLENQ